MTSDSEIIEVLKAYKLDPIKWHLKRISNGHINESFSVFETDSEHATFFLQKINNSVFENIEKLTHNAYKASHCINESNSAIICCPTFLMNNSGKYFYKSTFDKNWRLSTFMVNYQSLSKHSESEIIYSGGLAFGKFIEILSKEDMDDYYTTIPDFHNINTRLFNLQKSLKKPSNTICEIVKNLLEIVDQLSSQLKIIQDQINKEKAPLRICHYDTKLDNIMHNENKTTQSYCVVDLDTVMPGYLLFDYGDSIRSLISFVDEDEPTTFPLELNLKSFKAFHEGYLDGVSKIITKTEISLLHIAIPLLPFIMGLRFLTDYINGNKYFKINHPRHNLNRAINQLHLSKTLWDHQDELNRIIDGN